MLEKDIICQILQSATKMLETRELFQHHTEPLIVNVVKGVLFIIFFDLSSERVTICAPYNILFIGLLELKFL